ncbi:MAG: nucleotide-binding protein [Pseudomonadota bacterium]|nr:nucleotide-binding protein [Pseudomonadota bacterium]
MPRFAVPSTLRPRLFVASSVEARKVAETVAEVLARHQYEVELWSEEFFQPGASTYSAISTRIRDFDGGVFVLSPDDGYLSRSGPGWTARPNVVFELGMFAGVLDIGNCIQVRLKVAKSLPHLGREVSSPRARIEDISDLAGITWIEAESIGAALGGRTEFILEAKGADKVEATFRARAEQDARALHVLQRAPDLVAIWFDGTECHRCPAHLVVFGDRVRVRLWWEKAQRQYDVSLKFEAEDRLTGTWWDSGDRGYAGQASFQVRNAPQYLLGQWLGWSGNGGVKGGAFLVAEASSEDQAIADHEAVLRCRAERLLQSPAAAT